MKNWKQLFSSKLILYLLWQEYTIYFSFLTHILMRYLRNFHGKDFRPMKILTRKNLDPRNTNEKKFQTHEIPTRKNYGPTKARWHDSMRPTRPTMARDPRNLAHSINDILNFINLFDFFCSGRIYSNYCANEMDVVCTYNPAC